MATRQSPYAQVIMDDGPIAYWRLSEAFDNVTNPGNASFDQIAYGGTHRDIFFTGGGFSRQQPSALVNDPDYSSTLNGTTSYLVGTGAAPFNTGPFSFEIWAKITKAITATGQYLINDQNGATGRYLYVRDLGVIVGFWDPTLAYSNSATAPVPTTNVWHHFVGTFDGQATRAYVDSVQGTPSPAIQPQAVQASASPFTFGRYAGSAGNFMGGGLDEAAVYNYALTPQQVGRHFLAGKQAMNHRGAGMMMVA